MQKIGLVEKILILASVLNFLNCNLELKKILSHLLNAKC
jgi:hypothetical protein